jgi:hypothetical protein
MLLIGRRNFKAIAFVIAVALIVTVVPFTNSSSQVYAAPPAKTLDIQVNTGAGIVTLATWTYDDVNETYYDASGTLPVSPGAIIQDFNGSQWDYDYDGSGLYYGGIWYSGRSNAGPIFAFIQTGFLLDDLETYITSISGITIPSTTKLSVSSGTYTRDLTSFISEPRYSFESNLLTDSTQWWDPTYQHEVPFAFGIDQFVLDNTETYDTIADVRISVEKWITTHSTDKALRNFIGEIENDPPDVNFGPNSVQNIDTITFIFN